MRAVFGQEIQKNSSRTKFEISSGAPFAHFKLASVLGLPCDDP